MELKNDLRLGCYGMSSQCSAIATHVLLPPTCCSIQGTLHSVDQVTHSHPAQACTHARTESTQLHSGVDLLLAGVCLICADMTTPFTAVPEHQTNRHKHP